MKLFYACILLILGLSTVKAHENLHLIKLPVNKDLISLQKKTYILQKDTKISILPLPDTLWKYHPKGANFGIADKQKHIHFFIENRSSDSIYKIVFIPYHHINKIKLSVIHENKIIQEDSLGTRYIDDLKTINSRGYPFGVHFPAGLSEITISYEHIHMPLRGSVFLMDENQARETIRKSETTIWFWRGIFMFALFVSFILYLTTKINLFLYYFLLNAGVAMFIGMEIGDFFMFFDHDPYNFIIDIKHLGNILVVMFFPLFLNELTPIAHFHPKIWRIMLAGIFVMSTMWLACLLPFVKHSYFMHITVTYFIFFTSAVFLLQLFFLAHAVINKQRNARALLITYFFYITAVAVNVILPNLGQKEEDVLVYNTLMFGSIFEIFTFMILMGRETLIIYKERQLLLEKQKAHQNEIIRAIVESQEKERNKLGRELHDMIGANISVIRQHIDKANTGLLSVIDNTVNAVRDMSHGLVTPLIKDDEFIDEIKELCLMFSNNELSVKCMIHNWKKINNPETATHLYRIVQELLQNSTKHSGATEASVQFLYDEQRQLIMIYEDNGQGFDYYEKLKTGLGLINIENRVKLINGDLQFDTRQNRKGTTVIIELQPT